MNHPMKVLTPAEMRAVDQATIDALAASVATADAAFNDTAAAVAPVVQPVVPTA